MIDLTSFASRASSGPSLIVKSFAALSLAAAMGFAEAQSSTDVLDVPARSSIQALRTAYVGVSAQGETLLAVGARGAVLVSNDAGDNWRQITVPVSSDLATARLGSDGTAWILGHDAVVLRSDGRGENWTRLLDGSILLPHMLEYYAARAAQGDEAAERLVGDLEAAAEQSATPDTLAYCQCRFKTDTPFRQLPI